MAKQGNKRGALTRRDVLRTSAASIAAGVFSGFGQSAVGQGQGRGRNNGRGKGRGRNKGDDGTPFDFEPFTVDMPIPPVKQPLNTTEMQFNPGAVEHGIAPEYFDRSVAEAPDQTWYNPLPTLFYSMDIRPTVQEIIPGIPTPLFGYDGLYPGPTFRGRVGQPMVVRQFNRLSLELSTHLHGGHNPAHSDGYPNFYILPGAARDYFYTNTVPMEHGVPDFNESPSTMWYHDHGMDITAETVLRGLSGFFLVRDELEERLIQDNVLPDDPYDIPIVLQDRRFNADGTLFFDPLDHNGYLGDVWVVNGKAQPKLHVERRKYRFRFLNGSNARFWELRLSAGNFIGLGKDSWLFPNAIERDTLLLGMANRADVVIDFTDAPDTVFLENILVQEDGRGPKGKLFDREVQIPGTPVLQFIVEPRNGQTVANPTVEVGTPLRPHTPILPEEIVGTRIFEFERRKGAWQINQQFFDENLANATPTLGTAERWILRNGSGGWWHPIHIHLESHQIQRVEGQIPPLEDRFKSDTANLGGGTEVELFMKFRTFKGPFVFHCHNLEHEDMRMMFVLDPRLTPTPSPQPIQQVFP